MKIWSIGFRKEFLVEDDFAVTSQDLVDGLNRSSGAARVLGLNLDQTIAILTVMREATGRTGKEVGNALNSILSFMQRDVALQAFAREGIAVWADEARTQFRNVIDIFDEVAAKWPSMSEASRDMFVQAADQAGLYSEELAELAGMQKEFNDLQQRDLSQAMAGIYRRNYLLALLQNWAKIDQVLISMENSLGYSMRENQRTMQTLAKQYDSLKASAEELAVVLGDTGLLYELKELVDGTKDVITWFNDLDPTLRNLIIHFVEVTAAVKTLDAVMKMAGVGGAARLLVGVPSQIKTVTTALTALTTVARNAGGALLGLFGGPWGLAATAAIAGIWTLVNTMRKAEEEHRSNLEAAAALAEEYDALKKQIEELSPETEAYKQKAEELNRIHTEIGQRLPELVQGYNEQTDTLEINVAKLHEMAEASKNVEQAYKTIEDAIKNNIEQLKQEAAEYERTAQKAQNNKQLLTDVVDRRNELAAALRKQGKDTDEARKLEEQIAEADGVIAQTAEKGGLARLKAAGFTKQAVNEEIKLLEQARQANLDKSRKAIEAQKQETNRAIESAKARIKALEAEMEALRQYSTWWQIVLGSATSISGRNLTGLLDTLTQRAIAKRQTEMAAAKQQIDQSVNQLEAIQNELAQTTVSSLLGGKTGGFIGGAGTGGTGGASAHVITWLERFREALENAVPPQEINQFLSLNAALSNTQGYIEKLAAQEQYYLALIEDGKATKEDYARVQAIMAEKARALSVEQQRLAAVNDNLRAQLPDLETKLAQAAKRYEQMKAAGNVAGMREANQAIEDTRQAIAELNQELAQNSQRWYEAGREMEEAAERQISAIMELTRESLEWEEWEETRRINEKKRRREQDLQAEIDALEEASEAELELQEKIDSIEERLAEKRRRRDEEQERRRLEELRGQVESSRMVVVEQGMRRVTHDLEKERELQEAQAEAAYNAEIRRLENLRDGYQEELDTLRDAREEERRVLEQRLKNVRENYEAKLDSLREYYDSLAQDTILKQQAQLELEQKGYAKSVSAYEQYLSEMERLRLEYAKKDLGVKTSSERTSSGGGGGGGSSSSGTEAETIGSSIANIQKQWREATDKATKDQLSKSAQQLRDIAAKKGISEAVEKARQDKWKELDKMQHGGFVLDETLALLGEQGTKEVVLPLERAVPVLSDALLGAINNINNISARANMGTVAQLRAITVQGPITIEVTGGANIPELTAGDIGVSGRNLTIQAQAIHLQTQGRAGVDVLAQYAVRR